MDWRMQIEKEYNTQSLTIARPTTRRLRRHASRLPRGDEVELDRPVPQPFAHERHHEPAANRARAGFQQADHAAPRQRGFDHRAPKRRHLAAPVLRPNVHQARAREVLLVRRDRAPRREVVRLADAIEQRPLVRRELFFARVEDPVAPRDDQDLASGRADARELVHERLLVRHVLAALHAVHEVERGVFKRRVKRVRDLDAHETLVDVRGVRGYLVRSRRLHRGERDARRGASKLPREVPRPAADAAADV
eukprot:31506-Pelagococcus_subviridis.AAC.4